MNQIAPAPLFRVSFTGGESRNWALDEDLDQVRRAAEGVAVEAHDRDATILHSVWPLMTAQAPTRQVASRRVITHMPGEPRRYLSAPEFREAVRRTTLWVNRSRQAEAQLSALGIESRHLPYAINPDIFRPADLSPGDRGAARLRLGIPDNAFVVASFQRDSEGADLSRPKLVKGPDIFADAVAALRDCGGLPVHVLLAGPRRHWLRARLRELGIPFSFVGRETVDEDSDVNILPRQRLAELYALSDLYLVASRSEGGPHAVLEAAACRCPIISTPVGIAPDVLAPETLFVNIQDLGRRVGDAAWLAAVRACVPVHCQRVITNHVPASIRSALSDLYQAALQGPVAMSPRRRAPSRLRRAVPLPLVSEDPSLAERFGLAAWPRFPLPGLQAKVAGGTILVGRHDRNAPLPAGSGTLYVTVPRGSEGAAADRIGIAGRPDRVVALAEDFDTACALVDHGVALSSIVVPPTGGMGAAFLRDLRRWE